MKKTLKVKTLIYIIIIFAALFLISDLAQATVCTEGGTNYNPGDRIDCYECGEKTCQADGSWGFCQKKSTAGLCCNDGGGFKSSSETCSTLTENDCPWGTGCGQDVGQHTVTQYCSGSSDVCTGNTTDSGWSVVKDCYSWQKCDAANKSCSGCSGECLNILGAPDDPRYYNNRQEEYDAPNSQDPNNVFLPVKLAWRDIRGGGRDEKGYPVYVLTIENTNPVTPKPPPPPPPEAGKFNWPIGSNVRPDITSCFGWRVDPITNTTSFHKGIDLGGWVTHPDWDKNIYASATGTVKQAGWDFLGYGLSVSIEHTIKGVKFETFYAHLESVNVSVGQGVNAGEAIGIVDSTGWSTATHLHFGIYKEGKSVNPLDYLPYNPSCIVESDAGSCTCPTPSSSPDLIKNNFSPKSLAALLGSPAADPVLTTTVWDNSFIAENCLLKPGATHQWSVKACCSNSDGTATNDCGPESNLWSFNTNPSPELSSPLDKDVDVKIPVKFSWCPVENAESYYIQILKDGEIRHVDSVLKEDDTLNTEIEIDGPLEVFTGETTYGWKMATCLKEDFKKCGLNCGENELVTDCADFSRPLIFTTVETEITPPQLLKPFYDPSKPGEIPVVNLSDSLEWQRTESQGLWARSFYYEIKKGDTTVVPPTFITSVTVPFIDIWDSLDFNETYNWQVKSCYGENRIVYATRTDCSDFGDPWYFKTTGAPPTNLNADTTIIPVKLDWEDILRAASYKYEVAADSGFTNIVIPEAQRVIENSEVWVDYPSLKMLTGYWWRVKTCADKEGNICGEWSGVRNFTTFKLAAPANPSPQNGDELYTYDKYISWSPVAGAKAYQYTIDYIELSSEEKDEKCPGLVGTKVIQPEIVYSPSVFLDLECLGKYTWWVRACLDKNCSNDARGDLSPGWSFNFIQPTPPAKFGLVPCGRASDNPNTPWNEREHCQIKHIFILLRNIIDLLLWRIGLTILALLIIATGVVYYFSMGAPTTMVKVKSILKSAGIGYGIVFLAWLILNLLLSILGYQFQILGHWWQIKF